MHDDFNKRHEVPPHPFSFASLSLLETQSNNHKVSTYPYFSKSGKEQSQT